MVVRTLRDWRDCRRERNRRPLDTVTLAVIIPTYNEHETIGALLSELVAWFPDIGILVVDDNSPDHTTTDVRLFGERFPNVKLLERQSKQGLGSAYRDGVAEVLRIWEPEHLVFMDADGSHPAYFVRRLLASKADIAIGSRYVDGGGIQGWAWWRRALSRCGNLYARWLSGVQISDMTSGFMCISAKCLRSIDIETCAAGGYAFLMQVKFNASMRGSSIAEVPITFAERRAGASKISWPIVLEGISIPWLLRFRRFLSP